MSQAVTLLSGGLDSVVSTALAHAQHGVALALTFDYGQRAAAREISSAARFCGHWKIPHTVLQLPWLGDITHTALVQRDQALPTYDSAALNDLAGQHRSASAVWVPNRNGVFLNIAAAYAETHELDWIVTGFNAEEAVTFSDNSAAFVEQTTAAFQLSTRTHPRVVSYTQAMQKSEIAATARRLEIPLDWCWPCYEGGAQWCGRCESCARFQRAMKCAPLRGAGHPLPSPFGEGKGAATRSLHGPRQR
ncbi:MAG: 7-cyano-7-deazaguanine synthase QueC [Deltaproteobacteria bacterium]|nr:7-cyano-7-deazaguanine synthase QueC [Deltaproteobacteria bacterium]